MLAGIPAVLLLCQPAATLPSPIRLLLMVVDGRQPGWSLGATLPELAALMIEAGAWNAVNLDGGGSSAMWHKEPGADKGRVLNRLSDRRVRPAANHLGVSVATGN